MSSNIKNKASNDNKGTDIETNNEENELEEFYKKMPLTGETQCGVGCVKGSWMQKMANKKVFIVLYGITGCFLSSTYAYFNGTITTIEKRFKIPSKMTGVISIGNDITQLLASVLISYYGGKGHRPRWIACGLYTVALYCFLNALPHALYGPGEDALALTAEQGNQTHAHNASSPVTRNNLCLPNDGPNCSSEESSFAPKAILFLAQLISGIGGTIYYSLGFSYMDDNIKKSKSPVIISFSYFIRTLGPPIGYALVSACLKMYIAPGLTPVIDNKDPRWLGAWWLGWCVLGVCILACASMLLLLPKSLPRAAARKELFKQKSRNSDITEPANPSLRDMFKALKRIISNKVYLYSHLAGIFYVFGYIPFWIYLPKYIEIQYRQSASTSSFATGAVGLICSALGILSSGICIQKFKPSPRVMAAWNLFIGVITMCGIIAYTFLGCEEVDKQFNMIESETLNMNTSCASGCACEFSKYSPVCAADLSSTYISACHAGCTHDIRADNGTKIFTNCSCVDSSTYEQFLNDSHFSELLARAYPSIASGQVPSGGVARSGPCPVDCLLQFYYFLAIVCLLKFFGAAGRVSGFLISIRCVDEEDKSLSLGIGMTGFSLFAAMPAPIVFGYIIDSACLVWGKTCSGSGNCWLYNAQELRYRLNLTSLVFLTIGNFFDLGVWFVVKSINVYGENVPKSTTEEDTNTEDAQSDFKRRVNCSIDTKMSSELCSLSEIVPLQSSVDTRASDASKMNCFNLSDDNVDEKLEHLL